MTLTKRQHQTLEFIRDYRRRHGLSPTLEEIAGAFTISKVTVFEHIQALQAKGYIRKTKNRSRSIELVEENLDHDVRDASRPGGVPGALTDPADLAPQTPAGSLHGLDVLGRVAAGFPIEPIEAPESFEFTEMLPPGAECFLLRVEGNSMIDEQIRDGDLVLVESRDTARNGETVVAVVEGEGATVKRFYREDGHIRLQPANPEIAPIFTQECEIRGVVVGVIRKY